MDGRPLRGLAAALCLAPGLHISACSRSTLEGTIAAAPRDPTAVATDPALGVAPRSLLRFRETGEKKKRLGVLESATPASLVVLLEDASFDTLAVAELDVLEVWTGKQVDPGKTLLWTVTGALVGGVVAAGIHDEPASDFGDLDEAFAFMGGALVGGGIGLVVGVQPVMTWMPVDPATVSAGTPPAPSGHRP
jgi:hypothetical protein